MTSNPFVLMEFSKEVDLLAAAKGGDREAFLELVRYYQGSVYRLAYAMTRGKEQARALALETFVRAWRGMKDFPDGRRFFPWVLRIGRNLSVTLGRRQSGGGAPVPGSSPSSPPPSSSGGDPGIQERESRLLSAFSELRPDEQMALSLRWIEKARYEQVAMLLDVPVGVAILRLSQGRGLLLSRCGAGGSA